MASLFSINVLEHPRVDVRTLPNAVTQMLRDYIAKKDTELTSVEVYSSPSKKQLHWEFEDVKPYLNFLSQTLLDFWQEVIAIKNGKQDFQPNKNLKTLPFIFTDSELGEIQFHLSDSIQRSLLYSLAEGQIKSLSEEILLECWEREHFFPHQVQNFYSNIFDFLKHVFEIVYEV